MSIDGLTDYIGVTIISMGGTRVKLGKPDRWVNLITLRILSFWFTARGCGVRQSNSCVFQNETWYLSVRKTPVDQWCYIPHWNLDAVLG